jgi:hypothetical protein
MAVIWGSREAECFSRDDWTGGIALMWLRKLACPRNGAADRAIAYVAKRSSENGHCIGVPGNGPSASERQMRGMRFSDCGSRSQH